MRTHTAALTLLSILASAAVATVLASSALVLVPSGPSEVNGISWFGTSLHWGIARELLPFTLLSSAGTVGLALLRGHRAGFSGRGMLANAARAALVFAAVAAGSALLAPVAAFAELGAVLVSVLCALVVGVITGIAVHPLMSRVWSER